MTMMRLLFASVLVVIAFTSGLWLASYAAMLMNQFSILLGLLTLVVGLGLGAMVAAWLFDRIFLGRR